MNKLVAIILSCTVLISCSDSQKLLSNPSNPTGNKSDAKPVNRMVPVEEPWVYYGTFPYLAADKTLKTDKQAQELPHDNSLLNPLCAWKETTTVLDITGGISIQAPIITASANGEKYQVIYSFKKFTNIDSANVRLQVGVEVRLTASFTTVKGSLNLSLSGIGAAASAGKLSGCMTLTLLGASLPKIGEAFTATSSITAESIEKALQQIATLKSMIFETDAVISPYVIGIEDLTSSTASLDWEATQQAANNLKSSFKLK